MVVHRTAEIDMDTTTTETKLKHHNQVFIGISLS